MSAGWKTAALGEVCSLIARGVAPKYVDEAGTLVLNQKCVRDHAVNYSLGRWHDETAKRVSPDRFIQVGDVLINSTGTGTLGRVAQVRHPPEERVTVDTHVTIVRPKPGEFDLDFFGYALIVLEEQLAASGEGASGQTELARSVVAKFEISYPTDLAEQRRIVAVLDEAFAAITTATANAEKNLADVEELLVAAIRAEFGNPVLDWQTQPFDACIEKVKYPAKIQRRDFKSEGTFPIISQEADFINGYWNDSKDVLKVPSPLLVFGDHTQVLKYVDFDFVLGADGVKLLLPKKFLNARFLLYFLQANPMESKGYARHYRHLKGLMVPIPSLAEQKRIAARLDDISRAVTMLAEAIERKVELHSELRQSLLHRAFTGDLTATMPETIAA